MAPVLFANLGDRNLAESIEVRVVLVAAALVECDEHPLGADGANLAPNLLESSCLSEQLS